MTRFQIKIVVILVILALASPAFAAVEDKCAMNGAEYVPQNLDIQKSYDAATNLVNRTLSFVLRLEKGDMEGPTRSIFLNFEAYNTKGEKSALCAWVIRVRMVYHGISFQRIMVRFARLQSPRVMIVQNSSMMRIFTRLA